MGIKSVAKTKLLSSAETARIRALVIKRYMGNDATRTSFHPNTFLGTYEGLREDIIRVVPEAESSVSATRLRKLFYYSNPALCPPDQFDKGAFGKDFLEALEKYSAEHKVSIGFSLHTRHWLLGGLILFSILLFSWLSLKQTVIRSWQADFNDTSIKGLSSKGWKFSTTDSFWLDKQLRRDSMLTLWTLPGDFWVKEGEKRQVTNLLLHEVEGDCFSFTLKICDFYPYQVSQQVALYLFDENLNPKNWVRIGYECVGNPTEERERHLQITTTRSNNGEIDLLESIYSIENTPVSRERASVVWLKLKCNQKTVRAGCKLAYDWQATSLGEANPISFTPAFVGIGAYQGWTLDDGRPKGADTIPVMIDNLLFEPCNDVE